jgi:hypothetical protein
MPVNSRLEVNAAIGMLINRSDSSEDAARVVIQYGDRLKTAGSIQMESSTTRIKRDPLVSGHVRGFGNVEIEVEESKEFTFGIEKNHIGHYRLWKGAAGLICFHHFRKSGLVTQGSSEEDSEIYHLVYNPQSLEPRYFAIKRYRIVLNLSFVQFRVIYLEPIFGEVNRIRLGYKVTVE